MMKGSMSKKYNKDNTYSYTLGAYPTFELLRNKIEVVEYIFIHSDISDDIKKKLQIKCQKENIEIIENDRIIEKIRDKDNCLVIGCFTKYKCVLNHRENHMVLVNPSDTGNLGTIIRTCVGFGINNLAIIEPAVDIFNPKTIRASMGAVFSINFEIFNSFKEYQEIYDDERVYYPFMLNGKYRLGKFKHKCARPFSLIYGNEGRGLDDSYLNIGYSVFIEHSKEIDSLNLSLAAGIGIYEFTKMKS